jgi:hypothetical protein
MSAEKVSSAKAKIKRAEKHINEIEDELLAFGSKNPYKFTAERDSNTRELIYRMVEVGDPPDIAAAVGDALHNLRSALDHVICAFSTNVHNSTGFPLLDPAQKASERKSTFYSKINSISPEGKDIVERFNPHDRIDPDLWRLHKLDILDKHKEVVPVAASFGLFDVSGHTAFLKYGRRYTVQRAADGHGFVARIAVENYVGPTRRVFPLKAGDVIHTDPPDAEPDQDIDFRFSVVFNEPGIAEGLSIPETLYTAHDLVERIVAEFAKLP